MLLHKHYLYDILKSTMWAKQSTAKGFTIIELLIVVVVIAILATITVVAYTGIQQRATASRLQTSISSVHKALLIYKAENGAFPATTSNTLVPNNSSVAVRTDSGCPSGSAQSDWIPGLTALPQSTTEVGSRGDRGCYIYASDGTSYVLSAWNMSPTVQTGGDTYRRVGFREIMNQQYYLCNHVNIGGAYPAPYNESRDIYKYSYTYSNLTNCNETTPN